MHLALSLQTISKIQSNMYSRFSTSIAPKLLVHEHEPTLLDNTAASNETATVDSTLTREKDSYKERNAQLMCNSESN